MFKSAKTKLLEIRGKMILFIFNLNQQPNLQKYIYAIGWFYD